MYDILVAEIGDDPLGIGYSAMTADQILNALNEPRQWVTTQRFVSMRAVAAVLTDAEYASVKAALDTLASQSQRVADMYAFLTQASDDTGSTGGLDFGNSDVRAMIDALPDVSAETKTKLKRLGERQISRREYLELPRLAVGNIESALQMIGG